MRAEGRNDRRERDGKGGEERMSEMKEKQRERVEIKI